MQAANQFCHKRGDVQTTMEIQREILQIQVAVGWRWPSWRIWISKVREKQNVMTLGENYSLRERRRNERIDSSNQRHRRTWGWCNSVKCKERVSRRTRPTETNTDKGGWVGVGPRQDYWIWCSEVIGYFSAVMKTETDGKCLGLDEQGSGCYSFKVNKECWDQTRKQESFAKLGCRALSLPW